MSSSKFEPSSGRVTMRDVARAAGVSVMTVSNVINGHGSRAAEETRERVRRAIDDLGYRVNPAARSLRKGRSGTVCLAVPGIAALYYGELADRLTVTLAAHGF